MSCGKIPTIRMAERQLIIDEYGHDVHFLRPIENEVTYLVRDKNGAIWLISSVYSLNDRKPKIRSKMCVFPKQMSTPER